MCLAQLASVDQLRHAVEVDQQAEEHLVCGRTVFVNASKVAEDRDARHVLTVKSEHAGGLWAEIVGSIWRRDVAVDVSVVHIVGGGDLGEKARDHLNDVRDRHRADLKLPGLGSMAGDVGSMRLVQEFFAGQTLDVRQAADPDATGRVCFRASKRLHGSEGRLQARRVGGGLRVRVWRGRYGIGRCGMVASLGVLGVLGSVRVGVGRVVGRNAIVGV